MKYDWRSGNTTYFEDRRFEGTVIFDGRIKPHFAKVKIALAILPIWRYAHRCLVNFAYRFFCVKFNGIDDIAGGFT